ncbi:hypothetical protein GQX74_003494 [Glossina fuscipes]|nr:hypothetical protein GQX74_003494 [Glossina fuscipes]
MYAINLVISFVRHVDSSHKLKGFERKYPKISAYSCVHSYAHVSPRPAIAWHYSGCSFSTWYKYFAGISRVQAQLNHISLLLPTSQPANQPTSQLEDTMIEFTRTNNMFIETLYCDDYECINCTTSAPSSSLS